MAKSYSGYSALVNTSTAVLQGFYQTSAFKEQLNSKRSADVANANSLTTSYELSRSQSKQQLDELGAVLGNKLSERGLQAMQEESMLRTAAAETGTSGGTTDKAISEAYVNEYFDKANIINNSKQQTKSLMLNSETQQLSTENSLTSILMGNTTNVSTSSTLSGLLGGLQTGNNTFSSLTDNEKTKLFGIGTLDGNN